VRVQVQWLPRVVAPLTSLDLLTVRSGAVTVTLSLEQGMFSGTSHVE
jgi:hypothetical protein